MPGLGVQEGWGGIQSTHMREVGMGPGKNAVLRASVDHAVRTQVTRTPGEWEGFVKV